MLHYCLNEQGFLFLGQSETITQLPRPLSARGQGAPDLRQDRGEPAARLSAPGGPRGGDEAGRERPASNDPGPRARRSGRPTISCWRATPPRRDRQRAPGDRPVPRADRRLPRAAARPAPGQPAEDGPRGPGGPSSRGHRAGEGPVGHGPEGGTAHPGGRARHGGVASRWSRSRPSPARRSATSSSSSRKLPGDDRRLPATSVPSTEAERAGDGAAGEADRLHAELLATKDYLQSLISEHQTTTDELAAANEELIAGNEELQSTNEELQSAKEELQSTNEELTTVNDQLREPQPGAGPRGQRPRQRPRQRRDPGHHRRPRPAGPPLHSHASGRSRASSREDVGRPLDDLKLKIEVDDLPGRIRAVIGGLAPGEWEVRGPGRPLVPDAHPPLPHLRQPARRRRPLVRGRGRPQAGARRRRAARETTPGASSRP